MITVIPAKLVPAQAGSGDPNLGGYLGLDAQPIPAVSRGRLYIYKEAAAKKQAEDKAWRLASELDSALELVMAQSV